MAKKKQNLTFDTLMSFVSPTTQTAISEGHIQQINLSLLRPDPHQPRQLLPEKLNLDLRNGAKPIEIVQRWVAEAEEPFASPALINNIRELKRLAGSISQHGLINPITVRLADDGVTHQYTIITGERRYWAHALLWAEGRFVQDGDTQRDPSIIPAIIAPEGVHIRAHQLVENLLREDMNAIEKARGIWALRSELSNNSEKIASWKQVEEALGVSRQHRSRMVAVLNLPDEGQALVMQHNLTERTLRPIVQRLKDKPELQTIAIKRLARLQQENADASSEKTNLTQASRNLVNELLRRSATVEDPNSPIETLHRKVISNTKLWLTLDEETCKTLALKIASSTKCKTTVDTLQILHQQVEMLLKQIEANRVNTS